MPTIKSTLPRRDGGQEWPCVWCAGLTDILAETPGRPDIGRLPLHITCSFAVIKAFERLRAGMVLDESTMQRLLGYRTRLLEAGA